ncbi:translation initiation factor IF-3 [Candidatus Falkowbacteria bacterium CG10_big_fil_rev_8_21_14_0_10_37_14]|uniref:Translation initiation factor IF-3 n=1 Tax=Candidatus Falkowbacteria bacterium CG10_big_fil_rev_8_21_14_0_10_37_14 TaxID=1974561 RepID=A0A2M6WSW3_9BACT|nr:translation initiation factor IF-3 [Candidatus Falkowbacteria bacterium]PIT95841.1 MAG: translation initiation factor IF-3 [Candidatus Falkowbacteria bacterium CG10_big_fil_rev_8_21_14_0_10_37_14]
MRRSYRRPKPQPEKTFRANERIKAMSVILVDENGVNHGIVPTEQAITMAQTAELDLVEVNPKGDSPICKIMDYGQFKYERDKKLQKQKVKSKKTDTKGIRLSVRIGEHDLQVRYNKAKNFLLKGDKVKIEIRLRGRERQHPEVAAANINKFVKQLQADSELSVIVEEGLTKQETSFNMLLVNKKS